MTNIEKFKELIQPWPAIIASYEEAVTTAESLGLQNEELEIFMSRNCRAWFFFHHLRVEREAADQEIRSISVSPIVPFVLTDIQFRQLDAFEARMRVGKKFRVRVMKCRRARVSTIWLAIAYHLVRFNENKKGLVFTDRLETSRKLRRIIDTFYQSDDLTGKPEIGKKTLAEGLYLHPVGSSRENTSRDSFILLGSGEQSNSGIGGSLDFLVWSEAALTKDAETHWTTISPSLQGAIFDVAESTPSMTGQDAIIFPEFENPSEESDRFFISWMDVKEYRVDDAEKEAAFAPNVDHHLYGKEAEIQTEHKISVPQMLWRRFKLDELKNLNAFHQVFPISKDEAFYASAGLFFNKSLIDMMRPKKEKQKDGVPHVFSDQGVDISAIPDVSGLWQLYERRSPDVNYLVAADIAEGKYADREERDRDYSVAMVFKLTQPIEEVAIFRDRNVPVEIFAEQVAACARYYNTAFVIPERNGPGLAFLVKLLQLYQNIYRQQKFQAGSFVMTQDYGLQTTSTSKVHALSCLLSQIRDKDKGLLVHSSIVLQEASKFAQTGMKYSALPGNHDDTITCLWLMAICLSQTPSLVRRRDDLIGQPGESVGLFVPKIERDEWSYSDA